MRVVWTRGAGCGDLAGAIGGDPVKVGKDLTGACIEHRAELLVSRRITDFDLVPVASPSGFEVEKVGEVVGAVGGGPNSALAARLAAVMGASLGVPATLVCAYPPEGKHLAEEALADAVEVAPGLPASAVETDRPADLVAALPPDALLVIGAPGGSWLQRNFSGPGRRLLGAAPCGAVVVRDAPRRVFHEMREAVWVGPDLRVADARRVVTESVTPVVDDGRVVGLVLTDMLVHADDTSAVTDVMIDPVVAAATDALDAVPSVPVLPEHAPLPVVDGDGRLIGLVDG